MTQPFSREAVLAAQKELTDDRIALEAARILDLISDYESDDNPHGTVLRFTKLYPANPQAYVYVALKIADPANTGRTVYWTLTGNHRGMQFTRDELVLWLITEGLPVFAEDVEVIYPEGYEPAVHVCGDECRADADKFFAGLFGIISEALGDAKKAAHDEETDEPLSDSDIVLTSTGEDTEEIPADEDEINGDRTEDVTRD